MRKQTRSVEMEANIALLQFVALALPAIAILMQAVLRFHEIYDVSDSGSSLRIEFRFLEFAFLGLVSAAILFSIDIYTTLVTMWTKLGIWVLTLSLSLIFPATWFALRRAKYPSGEHDSAEDAAKSSVVSFVKLVIVICIVGLSVYISQRFDIFSTDSMTSVYLNLSLVVLGVFIIRGIFVVIETILAKREQKRWKEQLFTLLLNTRNEIEEARHLEMPEENEELRHQLETTINSISNHLAKSGADRDDELYEEVVRLQSMLHETIRSSKSVLDDGYVIEPAEDEEGYSKVRAIDNEALAEDVEMDLKSAKEQVDKIIDRLESEEVN